MQVMTEKAPGIIIKSNPLSMGLTTVRLARRGDTNFSQIYDLAIMKEVKIESDSCGELDTEVQIKSPEAVVCMLYPNYDELNSLGLVTVSKGLILDEYQEPVKVIVEVYNPTKKIIVLPKDTKVARITCLDVKTDLVRFIEQKPIQNKV